MEEKIWNYLEVFWAIDCWAVLMWFGDGVELVKREELRVQKDCSDKELIQYMKCYQWLKPGDQIEIRRDYVCLLSVEKS